MGAGGNFEVLVSGPSIKEDASFLWFLLVCRVTKKMAVSILQVGDFTKIQDFGCMQVFSVWHLQRMTSVLRKSSVIWIVPHSASSLKRWPLRNSNKDRPNFDIIQEPCMPMNATAQLNDMYN
ncbi:hypothetical protein HS088_TW16G00536 [Tripterygium wilfordii]|uniref:Uncharacterized protein n=1 Tax=Tripterygium wilfordii TaxID=458696 RepID=A0A7J7CJ78_TRIWF|nr:hypothetical protein HS088_TW16G00536 [Tripterygium wilfordii]